MLITDDEPVFELIWNEGAPVETASPIVRSDDTTRTIVFERLDVRAVRTRIGGSRDVRYSRLVLVLRDQPFFEELIEFVQALLDAAFVLGRRGRAAAFARRAGEHFANASFSASLSTSLQLSALCARP
jgi:hypothetical protein